MTIRRRDLLKNGSLSMLGLAVLGGHSICEGQEDEKDPKKPNGDDISGNVVQFGGIYFMDEHNDIDKLKVWLDGSVLSPASGHPVSTCGSFRAAIIKPETTMNDVTEVKVQVVRGTSNDEEVECTGSDDEGFVRRAFVVTLAPGNTQMTGERDRT